MSPRILVSTLLASGLALAAVPILGITSASADTGGCYISDSAPPYPVGTTAIGPGGDFYECEQLTDPNFGMYYWWVDLGPGPGGGGGGGQPAPLQP